MSLSYQNVLFDTHAKNMGCQEIQVHSILFPVLEGAVSLVFMCLLDLRNWMTINKLKLNTDKTELAVFYFKFYAKPDLFSVKLGDQIIHP